MDGQDFKMDAGNRVNVYFDVSNVDDLNEYDIVWKARTRTGKEIIKEGELETKNSFYIPLKTEDTSGLGGERLSHEATLIDGSGERITIARGVIKINESLFKD